MRRIVGRLLPVILAVAVIAAGMWLWSLRPWRPAVSVNDRVLTVGELMLRGRTLLDDARRTEHLMVPEGGAREAERHYAREAAKMWIMKEILLGEAVARGYAVTPADEQEALAQVASRLKGRKMTADDFFKEGPLSEDVKRRDFREGVLINKFTAKEVRDRISVTAQEIDARITELKRLSLIKATPDGKPAVRTDRRTAIDMLRAERFRRSFRTLFRALFAKADVKCPAFPELEKLSVLSPSRPEDDEDGKQEKTRP